MKKLILILLLCGYCYGGTATVTSIAELTTAVNTDANDVIHLNFAGGELTADLTFDHACTVDNVYGSDITLDGNDLYNFIVKDAVVTFTGTASGEIIFTQGIDRTVEVASTSAVTTLNMTYCQITDSNSANGISLLATPAGVTQINLTNCVVTGNALDGVSFETGAGANAYLKLVDCTIHTNGAVHTDQGITIHEATHSCQIIGGSIYSNAGPGFAAGSNGGYLYADDVDFYTNATADPNYSNISVSDLLGTAIIKNCTFTDANNTSSACKHISSSASGYTNIIVEDCIFENDIGTGSTASIYGGDGMWVIRGCLFNAVNAGTSQYAIDMLSTVDGLLLANNTFYAQYNAVDISDVNDRCTLIGNVFQGATHWAVRADTGEYSLSTGSGYNFFYGNAANFYGTNALHPTDSTANPLLDTTTLRIKRTSPAYNIFPNDEYYKTSGAVQTSFTTSKWLLH